MITLLSGRAALWGTAAWENQHHCCSSFQAFTEELKRVFDHADLQQGNNSVTDSIDFHTLAPESKWNKEVQWDKFLHGLDDRIQREIFALDLPINLDGLIELAIRVDNRLQRHDRRTRQYSFPEEDLSNLSSPARDLEPMQVGRTLLTREEKNHRRSNGLGIVEWLDILLPIAR